MKSTILTVIVLVTFQNAPAMAEEGFMCSTYFAKVTRKVELIKGHGQDLSQMAKEQLLKDLKFETQQCISECESDKFKFCNDAAKWIPQAEINLRANK
jgi:hypothetical protein